MPPVCEQCGKTDTREHPCGCERLVRPKVSVAHNMTDEGLTIYIMDNSGDQYRLDIVVRNELQFVHDGEDGRLQQPVIDIDLRYPDGRTMGLESLGLIKQVVESVS